MEGGQVGVYFEAAAVIVTLVLQWNVSALVGLIGLFGIAEQNSLVLVAQTRAFLAEGRPFRDALREASIGRVRPKIMTAATAILGLLPSWCSGCTGPRVNAR